MRKVDEMEQPTSCLNKAAEDEPLFVLRAKDPLAASAVEYWAKQAESSGLHEPAKCNEARHLASEMRNWRDAHMHANRTTLEREAREQAANRNEG